MAFRSCRFALFGRPGNDSFCFFIAVIPVRSGEVVLPNKFDELFAGSNKLLWIVRACLLGLTFSVAADALVFAMDPNFPANIGRG